MKTFLDVEETLDTDLDLLTMKFDIENDIAIKTEEYIDIDLDVSITRHKLSDPEMIAEVSDRHQSGNRRNKKSY